MIQYIITIMPGRPKNSRKSQIYKQKMSDLVKGVKPKEVKEDSKEDKPKQEKKKESKVEKVKKAFKKE